MIKDLSAKTMYQQAGKKRRKVNDMKLINHTSLEINRVDSIPFITPNSNKLLKCRSNECKFLFLQFGVKAFQKDVLQSHQSRKIK